MATSVYAHNRLAPTQSNESWSKLFEIIPNGSRVLDVGCSSGNFGRELMKHKRCEVTGVDINDADLAIAAKNIHAAYQRDVEQDDLSDLGTFDVIIMADVIEHLMKPVVALKKLTKQLTPKGFIAFSVPNMANLGIRLELLAGRFTYTTFGLLDETHLHYYDRVELEKVLQASDLQVSSYNNTIREVPHTVATDFLAQLGLEPTEKFWHLADHIDAITFQFIGIAKPGKAKHATLQTDIPHDFVSRMIDDMQSEYKAHLQTLQMTIKDQTKQLSWEDSERKRLDAELSAVYRSKTWRIATMLRAAKSRIGL